MKKAPSVLIKSKQGQKIYEPWMDYKEDSRPSTITSAPTITTPEAVESHYRFSDAYAETASTTTDNSTKPSFVPRNAVKAKTAKQADTIASRSAVEGKTAKETSVIPRTSCSTRSIRTPAIQPRNLLSRKSSSQPTSRERITSKQSVRTVGKKSPSAPNTSSSTTSEQSVTKRDVHSSPPPAYTPNPDYTKDKKSTSSMLIKEWFFRFLIAQIEVEFSAFYSWTTNGSEEDLNEDIIKKLLFPNH
ncbi:unnamed protein product [Cylicocyclus nassatus]|uniref:Uncharacterized protein n=1 Tax=Cylicocyclus nassatus TaxID=53992 RepID=A0AA36MEH6_CYLNA|nr:unnamed protein product [Cylicocyclus nassatus]